MTNFCIFDCAYCINRVSSHVEPARFSVEEVVTLTLEFYRRNYIEGLFLSSGIIKSPDQTMADMARIAKTLRLDHGFRGYIHLKTIPDASPELIKEAGLYADRLSINVELPRDDSLRKFAPEKRPETIRATMAQVRLEGEAAKELSHTGKKPPRFAPAGQSTQMIVGADGTDDVTILTSATRLYTGYKLRRVYYSAFSPIPDASALLPLIQPPLLREHPLYQADWLLRFYGFSAEEIATGATAGHHAPDRSEIEHCRWWLGLELGFIQPRITLALGASAAIALTGNAAPLAARRGRLETGLHDGPVLISWHPSYILRLTDPDQQARARQDLTHDLGAAFGMAQHPDPRV